LLAIAIIIICLSIFFIYKILYPGTEEEQVTLYSYSMTAGCDYKVHLKENDIYNAMVLEENMIYPKSIFDRLSVNYHAGFSGSSGTLSEITADYAIEVKVRGFQIKESKKRIVYERTFPVSEQSNLKFIKEANISEEVSIDLSQYESYVNNAESVIKANPSSEAELIFSGSFKAETEFGNKEEKFVYSIILPIRDSLFAIDKPADIEKTGSITKTEIIEKSVKRTLLIIPGIIIFVMLLFIVYIMVYAKLPTEDEYRVLHFKSIMRKHGSRIVRVSRSINFSREAVLVIKDIEGMIKISDQYNLSIFYIPRENGMPEENKMFIPGKDICYIYYLN